MFQLDYSIIMRDLLLDYILLPHLLLGIITFCWILSLSLIVGIYLVMTHCWILFGYYLLDQFEHESDVHHCIPGHV